MQIKLFVLIVISSALLPFFVSAQMGCRVLTRSLSYGSQGSEVTELQTFLIAQRHLSATATGYFGPLTTAAVKRFQTENNILPLGIVGPLTRASIARKCTNAGVGAQGFAPASPAPSSAAPSCILGSGNCLQSIPDLTIVRYHGSYNGTAMTWVLSTDETPFKTDPSYLAYWTRDGIVGSAYTAQRAPAGTVPLLALYNKSNGDHFFTVDRSEATNATTNLGYQSEGNIGYVYLPGTNRTANAVSATKGFPLYRAYVQPTGQHFYTSGDTSGFNNLPVGWRDEGIAAYLPFESLQPTKKLIGVGYEVWFDSRMWNASWGTPLLGRYSSNDTKVIDKHVEWLNAIGADFIIADLTNSTADDLRGGTWVRSFTVGNLQSVFREYAHLSQIAKPHPQITVALSTQDQDGKKSVQQVIDSGELQNQVDEVYTKFVKEYPEIFFNLDGKPLLLIYVFAPGQISTPPTWSDPRFTIRWMSQYLESQPNLYNNNLSTNVWWSWFDRIPTPAYRSGIVEAVSVVQAYAGVNGWLDATSSIPASGRSGSGGISTFASQWNKAISYNPEIILLDQWNELWAEQYSSELSNDLEPTVELGCDPIIAVQKAVASWKQKTLPLIVCSAE